MINPQHYKVAQEFFIEKIIAQSEKENIKLSRAEKYMLHWSEKDHSFHSDQTPIEEFEEEMSTAEFEKKISKLILRAYKKDTELNSLAKDKYRQEYKALKSFANYLFIMVDKAIGRHFNKLGLFFGNYPVGGGYILYAIFWGLLFLLGISAVAYQLQRAYAFDGETFKAMLPTVLQTLACGLMSLYSLMKYGRYKK